MDDKEPFGYISAEDLQVGDIVEWSRWSGEKNRLGILLRSNYGDKK